MRIKNLEIFNNIVLLSNKKIKQDTLHINNINSVLKYLHQNSLLISQLKEMKSKYNKTLKPRMFRIVFCFSDPYLMELSSLIKKEIFIKEKMSYKISMMESKDFYMNVPSDTKLVIFIGDLDPKYTSFCMARNILLLNVISSKFKNKANVYNLPFQIDHLSSLIWLLLFYKNV